MSTTDSQPYPTLIPCPACYGEGRWETECCSGAGGCDCRGQVIDMGACHVCEGTGQVPEDISDEQKRANIRTIEGQCFVGAGPTSGIWANMGSRGGHPIQ